MGLLVVTLGFGFQQEAVCWSGKFHFVVHGHDGFQCFPMQMLFILNAYGVGSNGNVREDGAFHASLTQLFPLALIEADAVL
jgi:hypothetical protein